MAKASITSGVPEVSGADPQPHDRGLLLRDCTSREVKMLKRGLRSSPNRFTTTHCEGAELKAHGPH
jgi:hypothetical protein